MVNTSLSLYESSKIMLDSSVISEMPICDFLLRCAEKNLYVLQLTDDILADRKREVIRRGIQEAKAVRFEDIVREIFSRNLVTCYQALIPSMPIQKKHQHVLAAVLVGHADVIVTYHSDDFSQDIRDCMGIEVMSPDEFSLSLYEEKPREVMQIIKDQLGDLRRPSFTLSKFLKNLEAYIPEFVQLIRDELSNFEKKDFQNY